MRNVTKSNLLYII